MRYHKFKMTFRNKRSRDRALRFVNDEMKPIPYLEKIDHQWVGDEFESKRIMRSIGFWKKVKEPLDVMDEIIEHFNKDLITGSSEPIKRSRKIAHKRTH